MVIFKTMRFYMFFMFFMFACGSRQHVLPAAVEKDAGFVGASGTGLGGRGSLIDSGTGIWLPIELAPVVIFTVSSVLPPCCHRRHRYPASATLKIRSKCRLARRSIVNYGGVGVSSLGA